MPYISWGAWSWGDKATWHWSDDELPALKQAWKAAYDAGASWIDTAQAYGSGESERITGDLVKDLPRDSYQIQTKWWVLPDNLTNFLHPDQAPVKSLRQSLDNLRLNYVDCYLVHGHIHPHSIKSVVKGLAECVDSGMTKTVGAANYDTDDVIEKADKLAKYNIPLATINVNSTSSAACPRPAASSVPAVIAASTSNPTARLPRVASPGNMVRISSRPNPIASRRT